MALHDNSHPGQSGIEVHDYGPVLIDGVDVKLVMHNGLPKYIDKCCNKPAPFKTFRQDWFELPEKKRGFLGCSRWKPKPGSEFCRLYYVEDELRELEEGLGEEVKKQLQGARDALKLGRSPKSHADASPSLKSSPPGPGTPVAASPSAQKRNADDVVFLDSQPKHPKRRKSDEVIAKLKEMVAEKDKKIVGLELELHLKDDTEGYLT
ncbi:hypothetical protein QBC41DRAFT_395269 [Cercophora samala]|uniref:Uncharacterized protein n=1 Tax=Cercophora samala TaxID=330535 RepID=A0AA39ZC58_9PEZI|nr:hypothetical protein QBC41DRAFT_395269 [Cercophora samala]